MRALLAAVVFAALGAACTVNFDFLPKDFDYRVDVIEVTPETKRINVQIVDVNAATVLEAVRNPGRASEVVPIASWPAGGRPAAWTPELIEAHRLSSRAGFTSYAVTIPPKMATAPVWAISNARNRVLVTVNALDDRGQPVGTGPVCLCLDIPPEARRPGVPTLLRVPGSVNSPTYGNPEPSAIRVGPDYDCSRPCGPGAAPGDEDEVDDDENADEPDADDPEISDDGGEVDTDRETGDETDLGDDTPETDTEETESDGIDPETGLPDCSRYTPVTFTVQAEDDAVLAKQDSRPPGEVFALDASLETRFQDRVVVLGTAPDPVSGATTSAVNVNSKLVFKIRTGQTAELRRPGGCYFIQGYIVLSDDFGVARVTFGKEGETPTNQAPAIDMFVPGTGLNPSFRYTWTQPQSLTPRAVFIEENQTYVLELIVARKSTSSKGFRIGLDRLQFVPAPNTSR